MNSSHIQASSTKGTVGIAHWKLVCTNFWTSPGSWFQFAIFISFFKKCSYYRQPGEKCHAISVGKGEHRTLSIGWTWYRFSTVSKEGILMAYEYISSTVNHLEPIHATHSPVLNYAGTVGPNVLHCIQHSLGACWRPPLGNQIFSPLPWLNAAVLGGYQDLHQINSRHI